MLLMRRAAVAAFAAFFAALAIGIPTGIIETPWYHRMTPVLWWNYPVWALSALLTGALVATYVRNPALPVPATQSGKTIVGSILSLFAVGCPICNKLVVMAIGVSGALNWFAPLQPLLAVGSLVLLTYALWPVDEPRSDAGSSRPRQYPAPPVDGQGRVACLESSSQDTAESTLRTGPHSVVLAATRDRLERRSGGAVERRSGGAGPDQ